MTSRTHASERSIPLGRDGGRHFTAVVLWLALGMLVAESLVGTAGLASLPSADARSAAAESVPGSDAATGSIASAVQTLSEGAGPAGGASLACQIVASGESGTCASTSSESTTLPAPAAAAAAAPPATYGAVMAYDAADGYVVLFGGSANGGTWTFQNGTWNLLDLSASDSPHERTASSMVYDAADSEIVLFGGEHSGSSIYTTTYFNDTWTFRAGTWTNITRPTDAPPRRYGAMMAYDAATGYVVMFGGNYERRFYNDTWKFVGGVWTNLSAETPAADTPSCRFGSGGAYDAAAGYVLMFGGVGKRAGEGCGMSVLNSSAPGTWAFEGGSWRSLSPKTSPSERWGQSMAYDAAAGAVVLFGGIGPGDVAEDDTWEFAGGNWTELSLALYPVSRFSGAMAYDSVTGYVVLYGGLSEPEPHAPLLSDVWTFSGGVWRNLTPIPSPPASPDLSLAYDAKDGYVLLFGGNPAGSAAETWRFVGGTWLKLDPAASPPPLEGASLTYDSSTSSVLLFGGLDGSHLYGGTWSYERGAWKNITKESVVDPPARYGAGLAYDTAASYAVLFGGVGASGYLSDTWTFAKGNWTELSPATSPTARDAMSFAYDATSKTILLFGGESASGPLEDTWSFSSGSWTQLNPSLAPPARAGAALVDDTADGYMLLFGGSGAKGLLNDTWEFSGATWSNVSPAHSPGPRTSAGMAFDLPDGEVALFGGETGSGALNDTWEYVHGVWTQLLPYRSSSALDEFSIQFTETGLPSGTEWWVNVTAGPAVGSTSSAILFSEPNGSYAYLIASVDKIFDSPGGTFDVAGGAVSRAVPFAEVTYAIVVTESGLPAGTAWWVNLTAGPSFGSDTASVLFNETNGSFAFAIASAAKSYAAPGGTLTVEGAPVAAAASFSLVQYEVTLTESGLPSGTTWWVNLTGGPSFASATTTVAFREPNGSYGYGVATADKRFFSDGGTILVDGSSLSEPTTFEPVTFGVSVTESGLPSGTEWWLNLTEGSTFGSSTSAVAFEEPNGTYPYTIATADKVYEASGGGFTVDGVGIEQTVAFVRVVYPVTFTERGLPGGTAWQVLVDGQTLQSATSSLLFDESNGSYAYSVGSVPGYSANSTSGRITVNGAARAITLDFSRETGTSTASAPAGIPVWEWVALGGAVAALAAVGTVLAVRARAGSR